MPQVQLVMYLPVAQLSSYDVGGTGLIWSRMPIAFQSRTSWAFFDLCSCAVSAC